MSQIRDRDVAFNFWDYYRANQGAGKMRHEIWDEFVNSEFYSSSPDPLEIKGWETAGCNKGLDGMYEIIKTEMMKYEAGGDIWIALRELIPDYKRSKP